MLSIYLTRGSQRLLIPDASFSKALMQDGGLGESLEPTLSSVLNLLPDLLGLLIGLAGTYM